MKLYYSSGACALSPNIALHEAGLDFDSIAVDLKTKKTEDGRDFYTINTKGAIPVLELDNGEILTEGPVILQYIADQVPEKNLAPANGTMERYHFQERLNFITSEIHKGFPVFFYDFPKEAQPVAREILQRKFAYVNELLGTQDYLMGDHFTLVDGYLYNVTRWTPAAQIDVKADYPHLYAFMERIEDRPCVGKALKEEGVQPFTANHSRAA